jgi:glycosyltransferase involved in cell wall biosynthesis
MDAGASKQPSILIVCESFDLGGTERVALRLLKAWTEAGRDVRVFVGRDEGPLKALLPEHANVICAQPPVPRGTFARLSLTFALRHALPLLGPVLIFWPGNSYSISAVILRLAMGRKCPPAILKISNALQRADMSPLMQRAYNAWLSFQRPFIDHFVAMSAALAREAEEVMGIAARDITVINDPVLENAGALTPRAPDTNQTPVVLAVGRFVPQKNFTSLIRAFAHVAKASPAQLLILGDGAERPQLEALIVSLGLEGRVVLPGFSADIESAMRAASLFVLSSQYEGLPAVLIEAMASGIPVVATNCSVAIADVLGSRARIVPVNNDEALAQAILETLAARHSADAARQRQEESRKYTMAVAAPAYLALADRVMNDAL